MISTRENILWSITKQQQNTEILKVIHTVCLQNVQTTYKQNNIWKWCNGELWESWRVWWWFDHLIISMSELFWTLNKWKWGGGVNNCTDHVLWVLPTNICLWVRVLNKHGTFSCRVTVFDGLQHVRDVHTEYIPAFRNLNSVELFGTHQQESF